MDNLNNAFFSVFLSYRKKETEQKFKKNNHYTGHDRRTNINFNVYHDRIINICYIWLPFLSGKKIFFSSSVTLS